MARFDHKRSNNGRTFSMLLKDPRALDSIPDDANRVLRKESDGGMYNGREGQSSCLCARGTRG